MKRRFVLVLFFLMNILALAVNVTVNRATSKTGYDNGDTVAYLIRVENPGPLTQNNIELNLPLSLITSSLDKGGTGQVFIDQTNYLKETDMWPGHNSPDFNPGSYSVTGDFKATGISLPPSAYVEYFVVGDIRDGVKDDIVATGNAKSGDTVLAEDSNTSSRVPYEYTLVKSTPQNYYESQGEIEYSILLTNTGENKIKSLELEDILINNLENIGITGTTGPNSQIGSSSTTGDLIATDISIAPGENVEFVVKGTVKSGIDTTILNEAKATVREMETISNVVTLDLAQYSYTVEKTAGTQEYTPGQNYEYKVKITNTDPNVEITMMKVDDLLSKIKTENSSGVLIDAFTPNTVQVSGVASSANSSAGNFNSLGDLESTNVKIAPGDYIEYTISGEVNQGATGTITNSASATDRNGKTVTSNSVDSNSVPPQVQVTKTSQNSSYSPGDTIVYYVNVENIGGGIGTGITVKDLVSQIQSTLANGGGDSGVDVQGDPLLSWSIQGVLGDGSSLSSSSLISNGGVINNGDLNDNITIYPNENILYTLELNSKDISIGDLTNKSTLEKDGQEISATPDITITPNPLGDNSLVKIEKTTQATEYSPGESVEYTIIVTNPGDKLMNNVTIEDLISQIKAKQLDGTEEGAFENWQVDVVSASGAGTVPGDFTYGTTTTNDFTTVADIGPNGEIIYKLTAIIKPTTVGKILDNVSGDNVQENGTGIKMSNPLLEIAKNVNSTEYTPGGTLTYTIDVDNPGDGLAVDVLVEDRLAEITTELVDGSIGPAYKSWVITAKIYDISSGTPVLVTDMTNEASRTGINGSFSGDQSQNRIFSVDNVVVGNNRRITYTVEAVISDNAKGTIKNLVNVNNSLMSDKGSITRGEKISVSKTGPGDYVLIPGSGNNIIEYTIRITNAPEAGVGIGINVQDNINSVLGELLGTKGQNISAFSSWEISVPTLLGPETKTSLTAPIIDNPLSDTINISPGGEVVYTIRAVLNESVSSEIIYGAITNSVTAGQESSSTTVVPKLPALDSVKEATDSQFLPGSFVNFKVTITNSGSGYANDAIVNDIINTSYFSEWTITGTPQGTGTTTGINGSITQPENLDTVVDIAPGGSVVYNISAKVLNNFSEDLVLNTVRVTDTQNNITQESSATVAKGGDINQSIDLKKRSSSMVYSPGGSVVYFIDVKNRTTTPINNIRVEDLLSEITATYANDLTNNTTDLPNQKAFDNWTIYRDVNNSNPTTIIESLGTTDLNDTITIPGSGTVTYKIVANVNERVVSNKIKNSVSMYNGNSLIGISSIEHNRVAPGGGITRTVDKVRYIPGVDNLTYTITVNSTGPGYQNNVNINELIENLQVQLIDGQMGNPFADPESGLLNFTVTQVNTNPTEGTEQDFTSGPANNQNLIGTVDIKPGESLQFKITGPIREDAIGEINNNGLITAPYRYNLNNTKTVRPRVYGPGETVIYTITVNNNSTGNAMDIPISDDIGGLKVIDSDGNSVPAFTNIQISPSSEAIGYKADLGSPTIDGNGVLTASGDIPIGGKLIYKITGTINEKAVGDVVNIVYIDGDSVSNQVGSASEKLYLQKDLIAYYDKNDNPIPLDEGFSPGGYAEFEIVMENQGLGILDDKVFKDQLSQITTDYSDGSVGRAFDNWLITLVSSTGASTNPDVNGSITTGSYTQNDIDTFVDIHPGGKIVYTIKCKINEKAVGRFNNQVQVNNTIKTTPDSIMADPVIVHTKQAFEQDGTTPKTTFYPGDVVVYKVRIENTGEGVDYLQSFSDLIDSIKGDVVETGSSPAPKEPVFSSYTATVETSGGNVTTIGTLNQTINLPNQVTIAQGGYVEFTITGTLKKTLIGSFTNISTYTGNGQKQVTINKVPTTISVNKNLVELAGKSFSPGDKYKPGDSVKYEIVIENTGKSFYDNLSVRDNIGGILTDLSGDTTGSALENTVVQVDVTNKNGEPVLTYIQNRNGNSQSNINQELDLAPGDIVTYTITGNIVKNALGTIPGNIVTVGNNNYESESIIPVEPTIVSSKVLITPVDKIYGPGEEVVYKLSLTNTGEGYGNDIPIVDLLSQIRTEVVGGVQGQAFSSWTFDVPVISETDSSYSGNTIIDGNISNNQNLNVQVDIAPTATVEITVRALTSSIAVGDITNVSTINGENRPSETITARKAQITVEKSSTSRLSNYSPDGEIGFSITITNTSTDAIANDISIKDIISGIKVDTINGGNEQAFKDGWTVTAIESGGNTNDVYIDGIPGSGDIDVNDIDIGPGHIVFIRIIGNANSKAIGDIINEATWSYNGQGGPVSATITPFNGLIQIDKKVEPTSYKPGEPLIYTLLVQNIEKGYIEGGKVIDDILDIQTDVAGVTDGTGPAFNQNQTVTLISAIGGNINTSQVRNTLYTRGYEGDVTIYPQDTLEIKLQVNTNPEALGDIVNNSTASYNGGLEGATATATPSLSNLSISKTVDKTNYESQDTLTYVLTVENTGDGWAENINVVDKISEITTTSISQSGLIQAFESWTVSYLDNGYISPVTTGNNSDLNVVVDIAPNSKIDFTVVGKLRAGLSGEIKNQGEYLEGGVTNKSNEVISTPKITNLNIVKSSNKDIYIPGEPVQFTIAVSNIENSIAENVKITDILSSVTVKGSGGENVTGLEIPAFSKWTVNSVTRSNGGNVISQTPATGVESQTDVSIETNLEANENITVVLTAVINDGSGDIASGVPVGNIINTGSLEFNNVVNNSTATLIPGIANLVSDKKISKLAGEAFTGQEYSPGDTIEYTMTISNTGDSLANNVNIEDTISGITTKLSGGSVGSALNNDWTITMEKSAIETQLYPESFNSGDDINLIADIQSGDTLTIKVNGTISDKALGVISANSLFVNSQEEKSDVINPKIGTLSVTKEILEGEVYSQGEIIKYQVKVSNTGEGFLEDINIVDNISEIMSISVAGVNDSAFQSGWTISMSNIEAGTSFTKTYPIIGENLNDTVDIAPGDVITFTIEGLVSENIIGDIINTVTVTNNQEVITKDVMSTPQPGEITVNKLPLKSLYTPSGEIGYNIVITNVSSTNVAGDIDVTDIISTIESNQIGGGTGLAFKPGWTITTNVVGDTTNSNVDGIPSSGDINQANITLGKETFVSIEIRGEAEENIYGDIVNNITATYNGVEKSGEGVIKSEDGEIEITKSVDSKTYTGGDSLTYTIVLKNTGLGVVSNFTLTDDLKSILTEISGEGSQSGVAFKDGLWSIVSKNIPGTSSLISESTVNGYEGEFDIAPGDTIEIVIKGETSDNALGNIENLVNGTYTTSQGEQNISDSVVSTANTGKASIVKSVDTSIYIPGEYVTYTLEIENNGTGWLRDLTVEDILSTTKTEILGGYLDLAFDLTDSEITFDTVDPLNSVTISQEKKPDLSAEVDIREGTSVKIFIKCKINTLAVGDILNTGSLNIDGQVINSNEVSITQDSPVVKITKTVDKQQYDVSQPLTYTIVIENDSPNNINGVTSQDLISEMRVVDSTGTLVFPFKDDAIVTFDKEGYVILERTTVEGNINDTLYMGANSKIIYTVSLVVKDNIVGVIQNVASKFGDGSPEVVGTESYWKVPVLNTEKTVITDLNGDASISQEEGVTYTITVEPTVPAFNVTIQDPVVEMRNKNNELVFDASTIEILSVTDGEGNSLDYTGDIGDTSNSIVINSIPEKAEIKIYGKVAQNIILESDEIIPNIVQVSSDRDNDGNIDGDVKTAQADLTVDQPELKVAKTATLSDGDTELYQGKDILYTIVVSNETPITAVSVGDTVLSVTDAVNNIKNIDGDTVFSQIEIVSIQDDNEVEIPKVADLSNTTTLGYTGDFSDTESAINLTRVNGESQITIVIKATVREDINFVSQEPITNVVELYNDEKAEAVVLAGRQELSILKTPLTEEVLLGESAEFQIEIENIGKSFANEVVIIDQISKIEGKDFNGNTIPVFTEWEVTGEAGPGSDIGTFNNRNSDLYITDAKIAIGEKLTYKIVGKTSVNITDDSLENTAIVTDSKNREPKESTAQIKIRKPLISVDKEAGVRETSIGKYVPYTIVVKNNEDQEVRNIYLRDNPPAGFKYVEDSLGVIQNNERVDTIRTQASGNLIVVGPFDLKGQEQLEIVYLMKVSIGAVHGKYKNIVFATNSSGGKISNESEAEVEVVEDPLFETTTVIGKVFHDRDGDGTQDDPRATKITVQQNIPNSSYVPNSTVAVIDGRNIYIPDRSVPISKRIEFKDVLKGRISKMDPLEKSKITLFIGLKDIDNLGDIRVTTNEGTDLTLRKNNEVILNHKGLKNRGMSSQNIVVRRELLKRKSFKDDKNKIKYYEKITIINTGIQEEGIPGVRIATVEGLVIITDQYGRFHIPEVSSKKGEKYILKVDPQSLPVKSFFMTENPKVQRLGSAMVKYNFGIVIPKTKILKERDGKKVLKVNMHPNMIFEENSSKLKPIISKKVLKRIVGRLDDGDTLLIILNRSNKKDLVQRRKDALKERLDLLLDGENIKVVINEDINRGDE